MLSLYPNQFALFIDNIMHIDKTDGVVHNRLFDLTQSQNKCNSRTKHADQCEM
jgi:hypothetical protein